MRVILLLFFLSVKIGFSQCPYHTPDFLIWKGDTIKIQNSPLSSYKDIDFYKYFYSLDVEKGGWDQTKFFQAEWKIIEKKLYLSNIYSWNYKNDGIKVKIDTVFSDVKDGLVFAKWYSDSLFVPVGDEHISLGVSPGYELYKTGWIIGIHEGNIISEELKTDNYYRSAFSTKRDSLNNFIISNIKFENVPKMKNEKERFYIKIKTGANKKDFTYIIKTKNEFLKKELDRIMRMIHEFDYYYHMGKIFHMYFSVRGTVVFEDTKSKNEKEH